ncbi:MFS transporter [Methylobacterium sp. NEAU 140]|uniref:MFS transporter n=1 Tax=Methylobacterium sp. NEAU 140 TaxID=3064945 RepID=UPI0027323C52|nr:MFS transporter [Methylobacterium sp. NEAU 140]MDP4021181.1 MFS transporter [Methylobacterium sp. NEAU 140]
MSGGVAALRPSLDGRGARYAVFAATYLYQGLVAGFSLTALANHLAARGVTAAEVGFHFALAGLPWTVQPLLWGPLIDRAGAGRRRPFAVAAILGCHAATLGLLLVPDATALGWLGLAFFCHSLCASLLDTACDRMIIDRVPPGELGRVSACTRAGFVVGSSLGAAGFAWTLGDDGFVASALGLLLAGLAATLPMLLVRERAERSDPAAAGRRFPLRRFLRRLVVSLRRPRALRLLALCFGLDAALGLFELPFSVDLVQTLGWEPAALSRLQAGLGLVGGTVGALVVGLWSDRAGPLQPLRALLAASAAGFLLAAGLIAAGLAGPAGPLILALTGALPGLLIVALMPALLLASRGRPGAATEFEVYMAAMNLGSVAGHAAAGLLAPVLPSAAAACIAVAVFWAAHRLTGRAGLLAPRG